MTSTITRIITTTLALLALSAPVAGATPIRDTEGVQTSSLAGTTSDTPRQDLRNADQQAPASPVPLKPYAPVEISKPAPSADDGGPSPLVFIVPSLVLVAMLGATVVFTRSTRPARV